jgi:hypothetical protein
MASEKEANADVSEDFILRAAVLPATYVNQFHISIAFGAVRLAFSEMIYGIPEGQPRLAVAMSAESALQLAALIYQVYGQVMVPPVTMEKDLKKDGG